MSITGLILPLAKTARCESSYALILRVLVLWCALLNVTQSRTPGALQYGISATFALAPWQFAAKSVNEGASGLSANYSVT